MNGIKVLLFSCMQDTFARARTRPKGSAKRARDDRVSCIQTFFEL